MTRLLMLALLCLMTLTQVSASPPISPSTSPEVPGPRSPSTSPDVLDLNLFTPFSTEAEVGLADLFVAPEAKDTRLLVYYWGNSQTCGHCKVFERDKDKPGSLIDKELRIVDGWTLKLPIPDGLPTFRWPLPDRKTWREAGYRGPEDLVAKVRATHRDAKAKTVKGGSAFRPPKSGKS